MTLAAPSIRLQRYQNKQTRFLIVYLAGLAMAFSPSKALGQLAPLIVLFGLIFFVQLRPKAHLRRYSLAIIAYLMLGVFYSAWATDFFVPAYLLFLLTGSALLFFLFDFSSIVDPSLLKRLGTWTLVIIFLESIYGTVQFILAVSTRGYNVAIGDFVWGTLAPPLDAYYKGSSAFFIILISTLAIFSLAVTSKLTLPRLIALSTVAVCWMAAAILHSVVYFALAVGAAAFCSFVLRRRQAKSLKQRGIIVATLLLFVLFGAGAIFHETNYRRIAPVIGSVTEYGPNASYRKLRAVYYTLEEVPRLEPLQPLFGLGAGQYSSRAALMLTGEYLQRASLPLPTHTNPLTEQFIMPLHRLALSNGDGTTHNPASSWIALYGEWGWTGVLVVLYLVWRVVIRFAYIPSLFFPRFSFAMLTLTFYMLFMGIQDVYWEYAQAVFPMALLLKLGYDYMGVELSVAHRARVNTAQTAKSTGMDAPALDPA